MLLENIGQHQIVFVPVRVITDIILLAYECFHTIRKKPERKPLCAIKLDMHKEYGHVEWEFLERIMVVLGFAPRWVELMMTRVTSVKYRIRFNVAETDFVAPSRGLWYGDPLSMYLYVLCAEG